MKNIPLSAGWYKIKLGQGNKTHFWKDKWLINVPLFEAFPRLYRESVTKTSCVNHRWSLPINDWKVDFRRNFSDLEVEEWASLSNLLSNIRPNDREEGG